MDSRGEHDCIFKKSYISLSLNSPLISFFLLPFTFHQKMTSHNTEHEEARTHTDKKRKASKSADCEALTTEEEESMRKKLKNLSSEELSFASRMHLEVQAMDRFLGTAYQLLVGQILLAEHREEILMAPDWATDFSEDIELYPMIGKHTIIEAMRDADYGKLAITMYEMTEEVFEDLVRQQMESIPFDAVRSRASKIFPSIDTVVINYNGVFFECDV